MSDFGLDKVGLAGFPGSPQQEQGTWNPGQGEKQALTQVMQRLMSRMGPTSHLAPPIPPQQPERAQMAQGTARTPSEGTQMFLHNLGATIQNAVAAHKEKQIRTAMADYQGIQSAWEMAQATAGDPSAPDYQQKVQQMFQQSPITQAILGDPKKMKNIAKAFNQDWLNPEKTTVYGEALKRHMEADKAGKMLKMMRALHLAKGPGQPQLDPQQQQQFMKEEASRLPMMPAMDQATMMQKTAQSVKALADAEKAVHETNPYQDWKTKTEQEQGKPVTAEQVMGWNLAKSQKPIDDLIAQGIKKAQSGDLDGAKADFALAQQGAQAKKIAAPNLMSIIDAANKGNPDAIKNLQTYMTMQKNLSEWKGQGYGMGRAMYMIQNWLDPKTGEQKPMSNLDAINAIRSGQNLVSIGRLNAQQVVMVQRMQRESEPAIEEMRKYMGAFDNGEDRKIYAKIMAAAPPPTPETITPWLNQVINQAMASGLSPDGRKLAVRAKRLNEIMGTVRQATGLPSTEQSMLLTLSLVPGPGTPDSKFAADQLDQLSQIIEFAIEVPALKGVTPQKAAPKIYKKGEIPTAD